MAAPISTSHSHLKNLARVISSAEDPSRVFSLTTLLGRGNFGSVYKALNKKTDQIVAIKVISLVEEEALDDVQREISILKECDNTNIVKYFGSYCKGEFLWIVMEYCAGGSCADILRALAKPFSEDQIALICRESLKGLRYLHQIHKIHRDIKGGNILLTANGQVKLADFGVSANLYTTFARRNTFVGTPFWMAPEVILEKHYDGRADNWSIGITAIELAEMRPPQSELHPMRVIFLIPHSDPPQLKHKSKWSEEFQHFVKSCLTKNAAHRPTADKLLKHKFLQNLKPNTVLVDLVNERKLAEEEESGKSAPTSEIVPEEEEDEFSKYKGYTIQVPWLDLKYMDPVELLSSQTNTNQLLTDLCSNKVNVNKLNLNPQMGNLARIFGYQNEKKKKGTKQLKSTTQIVHDLEQTLKTILEL